MKKRIARWPPSTVALPRLSVVPPRELQVVSSTVCQLPVGEYRLFFFGERLRPLWTNSLGSNSSLIKTVHSIRGNAAQGVVPAIPPHTFSLLKLKAFKCKIHFSSCRLLPLISIKHKVNFDGNIHQDLYKLWDQIKRYGVASPSTRNKELS